jgi:hypothetical protein
LVRLFWLAVSSARGNVLLFWNSHDVLRVWDVNTEVGRQPVTDPGW